MLVKRMAVSDLHSAFCLLNIAYDEKKGAGCDWLEEVTEGKKRREVGFRKEIRVSLI